MKDIIKNMRSVFTWIVMLTKRYFRNPLFIITLLAIPAFVIGLNMVSGTDEGIVRVALYAPDGAKECTNKAINSLVADKTGAIIFYRVTTEEELYDAVRGGQANCGFAYPKNLEENIDNYVENKVKKLDYNKAMIKMVSEEDTNYVKIAKELVFGSIYDKLAIRVRDEYLAENENTADMTEEDKAIINDFMDDYEISEEFFEYQLADGTQNKIFNSKSNKMLLLPIKGILYTIILLSGMMGVIAVLGDMEKGMFASIQIKKRKYICYLYVLVPTIITAIVSYVALELSGVGNSTMSNVIVTLLYIPLVTGMCGVLMRVFKGTTSFVAIIPIYILMNLVVCPVFVDFSSFVPQIKIFRYILPVKYGLTGMFGLAQMLIAIVITNLICCKDVEEI